MLTALWILWKDFLSSHLINALMTPMQQLDCRLNYDTRAGKAKLIDCVRNAISSSLAISCVELYYSFPYLRKLTYVPS